MRATWTLFALGMSALLLAACGRPFDVKTAPGFIELEEPSGYDYRATTPEGVVFSVRAIDNPSEQGDLAFWTRAITLRLRDVSGYALLDTHDVTAKDGTKGKQLRFGHDEQGKPYSYWVTLFVAQSRVFIVEAGGTKPQVERFTASLDWMHKHTGVQCNTFVSPVLASRTCNRW
jgi:hypothetical protein